MRDKSFILIINLTTLLALGAFAMLGWIKMSQLILVGSLAFISMNIAAVIGLRLRRK
jgi:hypothetical protein